MQSCEESRAGLLFWSKREKKGRKGEKNLNIMFLYGLFNSHNGCFIL